MHGAPEFLTSLAIVFCVAGVTTVVLQRLRQPVVFGYLVAGMIVGPHIPIPPVADPATIQALSEVGVILLLIGRHWVPVVVFLFLVLAGKIVGVTTGTLLAGYGVRTSLRAGMNLAQIGEVSFIIAMLGLPSGATREFLYPLAVAAAAATTVLTPWLIR